MSIKTFHSPEEYKTYLSNELIPSILIVLYPYITGYKTYESCRELLPSNLNKFMGRFDFYKLNVPRDRDKLKSLLEGFIEVRYESVKTLMTEGSLLKQDRYFRLKLIKVKRNGKSKSYGIRS